MRKIRVLVVDDQKLFAGSLKVVLDSHGREELTVVGIAYNGRQAIEMVADKRPDVVLMDVRMPVLDGVQATRIITEQFPEIRVMILTTFDDDDYALQALSNGASGYVLKSIQPDELVTAVKAVWSGTFLTSSSVGMRLVRRASHDLRPEDIQTHDELRALICEFPELTRREVEVLRLMTENLDNREISAQLFIAEQTVKNYMTRIYQRLNVPDRLHAIQLVKRRLAERKV